jgi:hypothetical protein
MGVAVEMDDVSPLVPRDLAQPEAVGPHVLPGLVHPLELQRALVHRGRTGRIESVALVRGHEPPGGRDRHIDADLAQAGDQIHRVGEHAANGVRAEEDLHCRCP